MIFAKFYIESKSNVRGKAESNLKKLLNELKKERDVKIIREFLADEIYEENLYSSYLDLDLEFKSMISFLYNSLRLAPVVVEVYKPSNLILDFKEFTSVIKETIRMLKNIYTKYNIFIKVRGFEKNIETISKKKVEELLDEGYLRVKMVFNNDSALLHFLSENYYLIDYKVDEKNKLLGTYLILKPYEIFLIISKRIPVYIQLLEDQDFVEIKNIELQDIALEFSSIINEYVFRTFALKT